MAGTRDEIGQERIPESAGWSPSPGTGDAETSPRTGARGHGGPGSPASPQIPPYLTGRARKWYLRAAEHHSGGRPDRAAELLISAVAAEPSLGCLREALARAQYDAKQYLAARTTFTAMTAIDPKDHYALFGLGLAETRLGAHEAAARHLKRAVSQCPEDPRYELALVHAQATLRRLTGDRAGHVPGPGST